MKNLFFKVLILLFSNNFHGQNKIKVIDKNTSEPIPYTTIKVLNQPKGVIASDKGEFNLAIINSDSILVSSVGYYQTILIGEKIGTTITLVPKIKTLSEVTVGLKKVKRTLILGTENYTLKEAMNWGPAPLLKEEFAQRIELPDSTSTYKVKKIFIPVRSFRCWGPLMVHIYAADSSSDLPGEELFVKLIDVQKKDIQQKRLTINLDNDGLYLTGESYFFISMGWPEDAYNNKCITTIIMSRSSTEKTYSRQLATHYKWSRFGQFRDLNGNAYQASSVYSVEVEELK